MRWGFLTRKQFSASLRSLVTKSSLCKYGGNISICDQYKMKARDNSTERPTPLGKTRRLRARRNEIALAASHPHRSRRKRKRRTKRFMKRSRRQTFPALRNFFARRCVPCRLMNINRERHAICSSKYL